MNKQVFTMEFTGRSVGAIGITHRCIENVKADCISDAYKALYHTHEHISDLVVDGKPVDIRTLK
jgi:hypothetical protein